MEGERGDGPDASAEEAVKVTDRVHLPRRAAVAQRGNVKELDELVPRARRDTWKLRVHRESREPRLVRGDRVGATTRRRAGGSSPMCSGVGVPLAALSQPPGPA